MGELLAAQAPVEADLVMGVPESGVPAAEGFARASGIPYGQGLVKNRYIGRTFITPTSGPGWTSVRRKLNPLRENIAGKRIVVVDDSIVRGTTPRAVVAMLRDAGAREVHLRISSPALELALLLRHRHPRPRRAPGRPAPLAEIEEYLGVDSLAYLCLENLVAAIDAPGAGFCTACLTGDYPVPVPVRPAPGPRRRLASTPAPAPAERALQAALPGV